MMQPVRLPGSGAIVPQAGTHRNPRTREREAASEQSGPARDFMLDRARASDSATASSYRKRRYEACQPSTLRSIICIALNGRAAQKLDRAPRTPYTSGNG
jgi:hypothetical protein